MGITNLHDVIRTLTYGSEESASFKTTLEALQGSSAVIDVGFLICRFFASAQKHTIKACVAGGYDYDPKVVHVRCIYSIVSHIIKLIKNDMEIYVVFDGKTPKLKEENAGKIRKEAKAKSQARYDRAMKVVKKKGIGNLSVEESAELISAVSGHLDVSKEFKDNLKRILQMLDIYVIQAVWEADVVCGFLSRLGCVDYVITRDGDLLVHGANNIVYFDTGDVLVVIILENVLRDLGLDFKTFQKLCVLGGCDYNKGIRSCRIKTLLKLHDRYGSFERAAKKKKEHGFDFAAANMKECLKLFNPEGTILDHIEDVKQLTKPDTMNLQILTELSKAGPVDHIRELCELYFDDLEYEGDFTDLAQPDDY